MAWWSDFGPARPVEGGLTSAAKARGSGAEAAGVGAELVRRVLARTGAGVASRGRSYARQGQTVSLDIERGRLSAAIQGSGDAPYLVTITGDVTDADRSCFLAAVRAHGPETLTTIPTRASDALRVALAECHFLADPIVARCSCPYGGVCKHLVALAYVAGERLDESPAAVGALLGITDADLSAAPDDDAPDTVVALTRFDRRRQARLARTLAGLETREPPTRAEVLSRMARVLPPPPSVAQALDLADGPEAGTLEDGPE